MELGTALLAVGAGDRAARCEIFSDTLDPAWINAALHATDRATVRRPRRAARNRTGREPQRRSSQGTGASRRSP